MDRRKFETFLQDTLEEKSRPVSMSEARREQIHQAIRAQSERQTGTDKEETIMRLGFKRKVILTAAAMCLFGTAAALAAGKIAGYYTGGSIDRPTYEKFADLASVEEQAGFPMKAVETFENGYNFQMGFLSDVEARDEAGNIVETFPEVILHYKNGDELLTVTARKARAEETFAGKVETSEYGDLTLLYKEDNYLFLPPDQEPSEADKKAEEAGELYISYGSSEEDRTSYRFLQWDEDGTRYLMMADGEGELGQEEMVKAARQIIDSKNDSKK